MLGRGVDKKGQLTGFIIFAIFIVLFVGLFFVFRGGLSVQINDASLDDIPGYMDGCLENALIEGVYLLSLQGGYYDFNEGYISNEDFNVPIYYSQGEFVNVPTKEILQDELEKYVSDEMKKCYDELEDYHGEAISTEGIESVSIDFSKDNIYCLVDFSVTLSKAGKDEKYETFEKSVAFDYLGYHEIVSGFLELQKLEDGLPISLLTNYAVENNFKYEVYLAGENNFVLDFIFDEDIKSQEYDKYKYSFAVSY